MTLTLAQAMKDERKKQNSGKLCIDCKYYTFETNSYGTEYAKRCIHPKFLSPIDGDGTPLTYARLESTKCGPSGKLWEPKPPRAKTSLLGWLRGAQ